MSLRSLRPALPLFAGLLALLPASASAQIFTNGTGGGAWDAPSTWEGGSIPAAAQSWTILSGDTVTRSTTLSGANNVTGTITGTLTFGSGAYINIASNSNAALAGINLNINGGALTTERIFTNPTTINSSGRITISSGTLSVTNRLVLTNTTATSTAINSFTQSGGTVDLGASGYFQLYGAGADDRAQFTIIGNAGTFNSTARSVTLFNTADGFEHSATDINFTFGAAAGAGALTVVNAGGLVLGGNAVTRGFTHIDRSSFSGSFSTTLFDYSGTLTGTFGTLTSIGLGAGESATLVHDTVNKLIRVDYTLAPIPEPAAAAVLAGLGSLGLAALRRRR